MGTVVEWLGHASFKISFGGKVIYIDPYEGEYTEKADLILITHSHHDHCDNRKVKLVWTEATMIIAPADCAKMAGGRIKSLKPGEKATIDNITVKAIDAYNMRRFRSPGIPFHPRGLGVGYLIMIGGKTIYHAGDTDFIPEMKDLRDIYLALLPAGGTYTMDNTEAAEATLAIRPNYVIPMHLRETDPGEYKNQVKRADPAIKVILLRPGERLEI